MAHLEKEAIVSVLKYPYDGVIAHTVEDKFGVVLSKTEDSRFLKIIGRMRHEALR